MSPHSSDDDNFSLSDADIDRPPDNTYTLLIQPDPFYEVPRLVRTPAGIHQHIIFHYPRPDASVAGSTPPRQRNRKWPAPADNLPRFHDLELGPPFDQKHNRYSRRVDSSSPVIGTSKYQYGITHHPPPPKSPFDIRKHPCWLPKEGYLSTEYYWRSKQRDANNKIDISRLPHAEKRLVHAERLRIRMAASSKYVDWEVPNMGMQPPYPTLPLPDHMIEDLFDTPLPPTPSPAKPPRSLIPATPEPESSVPPTPEFTVPTTPVPAPRPRVYQPSPEALAIQSMIQMLKDQVANAKEDRPRSPDSWDVTPSLIDFDNDSFFAARSSDDEDSFDNAFLETDNSNISEGPCADSDDSSSLISVTASTMVTRACFRQEPSSVTSSTTPSPPGFFKRCWTWIKSWF